jgi:LPXTG-motif cell wall-anchored protein
MQIAMAQILPRTATPAQLFMIIGALLLLTALLLRRRLFSRW